MSAEKNTYLTERNISTIQENWLDYAYAEDKVGIPVLLLAAIHYREADLHKGYYSYKRKKLIKNIGGPFMLDLGPLNDNAEFVKRIRGHEKYIHTLYGGVTPTPKVSHDFKFAVLVAAHHLLVKSKCDLDTEECMAYAVWGYNGRPSWHKGDHKNSSYVWSDPKNGVSLMMRYRKKDGTIKEFTDTRPGVMVIYKELLLLFSEE